MPLFAYEAVLNLIGMAILLFVIRRFGPRLFAGDAVLMYFMWYGAVRTLLETVSGQQLDILGVPTAMWIGIIAVRPRRRRGSFIRHRRGGARR